MPAVSELNYFDLAVLTIFCIFMLRGLWVGLIRQLAGFFALAGSYIVAGKYAGTLLSRAEPTVGNPKVLFFCGFAILFIMAVFCFAMMRKVLHRFIQVILAGWLNRFAGMVLGGCQAALISTLAYMFLASSLSANNDLIHSSYCAPYFHQGMTLLHVFIDDPRLRAQLTPKKPAITGDLLSGKPTEKKVEPEKTGQP
ncbi:MAG: CvpA family protein [Desulfobulbus sp.]|nr:CvpA family protein [Desulfobulbus sp.]